MGIAEYVVRELMREFTGKTREFYEFVMPPVDIYEDVSDLVVVADMPGFKKEDIVVRVSGNILSVRATREKPEPTGIVYWQQRPLKIDKKIPLPFSVAEEDVKATYKEGLLEIRVPLKGAVKIE